MKVPSVNDLMTPVLSAIRSLDGIGSKRQISEEIVRDMALPKGVVSELRESGTETRLHTRLTMALAYMKSYGLIDNPRPGTWVLTNQGRTLEAVDGMEVSRAYRRKPSQTASTDSTDADTENIDEILDEDRDDGDLEVEERRPRESLEMQALVARVGKIMGMDIWVPASDRTRMASVSNIDNVDYLNTLPLSYGDEPLRTIEQIDVIWIKGSYIERAFEIEHTTAIYSGILRMADLMALIPNMSIKMHIVAPDYRREQVLREIRRPVFRRLPSGPLSESCTYISYGKFREFGDKSSLRYMRSDAVEEFVESAG